MTAPNVNVLWGRVVADELAKSGVGSVVLSPGSRCTPLTVAFAEHPGVETFSHLDERSAAYFALGRAKRTGKPTPLVCTSGTALANFHPAVVEADRGRVPMLLLTADRPPELRDSGANQTVDQEKFYGDAVRAYRSLPEPEVADRKLRSLRTALSRAVATTTGNPPGPVHLNCPFRKPLEPTVETDDVAEGFADEYPLAVEGREGPYVEVSRGVPMAGRGGIDVPELASDVRDAERGLVVCGPTDRDAPSRDAIRRLAAASGYPVLADPLSGVRFGEHVDDALVCGGYDSYLAAVDRDVDLVVRFGASPTSKTLRRFLSDRAERQLLVDPAAGWREAEFAAGELVVADETRFANALASHVDDPPQGDGRGAERDWRDRLACAEEAHWDVVAASDRFFEGRVLADVAELAPDPSTVFVSNSMPVRDLDRFARPRAADLTVLGNRGASGIDGITSTALGAGSATDDPLVLVTGDLAYYHDANGLIAARRFGVDATIVIVNNDGGGIFHRLPIADHDTFEAYFRTPHGLDFSPTGELYGLEFVRPSDREAFREAFRRSVGREGTQVIEVRFDAEESHEVRDDLRVRVERAVGDGG